MQSVYQRGAYGRLIDDETPPPPPPLAPEQAAWVEERLRAFCGPGRPEAHGA